MIAGLENMVIDDSALLKIKVDATRVELLIDCLMAARQRNAPFETGDSRSYQTVKVIFEDVVKSQWIKSDFIKFMERNNSGDLEDLGDLYELKMAENAFFLNGEFGSITIESRVPPAVVFVGGSGDCL